MIDPQEQIKSETMMSQTSAHHSSTVGDSTGQQHSNSQQLVLMPTGSVTNNNEASLPIYKPIVHIPPPKIIDGRPVGRKPFNASFDRSRAFPQKLLHAVEDPSFGFLRWANDGLSVMVNEKDFEEGVLSFCPGLVQIPSFGNFRRQLREYGFEWAITSQYEFEFRHPCFVRHNTDLICELKTRRRSGHVPTRRRSVGRDGIRDRKIPQQMVLKTQSDSAVNSHKVAAPCNAVRVGSQGNTVTPTATLVIDPIRPIDTGPHGQSHPLMVTNQTQTPAEMDDSDLDVGVPDVQSTYGHVQVGVSEQCTQTVVCSTVPAPVQTLAGGDTGAYPEIRAKQLLPLPPAMVCSAVGSSQAAVPVHVLEMKPGEESCYQPDYAAHQQQQHPETCPTRFAKTDKCSQYPYSSQAVWYPGYAYTSSAPCWHASPQDYSPCCGPQASCQRTTQVQQGATSTTLIKPPNPTPVTMVVHAANVPEPPQLQHQGRSLSHEPPRKKAKEMPGSSVSAGTGVPSENQ